MKPDIYGSLLLLYITLWPYHVWPSYTLPCLSHMHGHMQRFRFGLARPTAINVAEVVSSACCICPVNGHARDERGGDVVFRYFAACDIVNGSSSMAQYFWLVLLYTLHCCFLSVRRPHQTPYNYSQNQSDSHQTWPLHHFGSICFGRMITFSHQFIQASMRTKKHLPLIPSNSCSQPSVHQTA